MGAQLLQMYDEAKKIGGFGAQVELAIITKMSSIKAHGAPDNPENIEKFKKAMDILREKFKSIAKN